MPPILAYNCGENLGASIFEFMLVIFGCAQRIGLGEVRVIEFRQARRTEAKFIV